MDDRLIGVLLRLYPEAFRERFGEEMRAAYRAQLRATRERRGATGVFRLRLRTVLGMLRGAITEWRGTTMSGRRGGDGWMERWRTELGQAGRRLRRAPGFSALAVLTLGLGTGAFTATWAVTESVLLEPMPYEEPEELAWVWRDYWFGLPRGWLGPPDVLRLREQEALEGVAAIRTGRVNLTGPAGLEPADVRIMVASADLFELLGTGPVLGRGFLPGEDEPGAPLVVVLGHALWTGAFGADPAVLGRTVYVDGEAAEVVGVLPEGFAFVKHSSLGEPVPADLYAPLRMDLPAITHGGGMLAGLARVRDGATPAEVEAALERVSRGLTEDVFGGQRVRLWAAPLQEDLVGGVRTPLLAILAAAGFLLLVLTANLATLFLARAAARARETAVRSALGAGRRGLARTVLGEALLVALLGGGVGLLLAHWGTGLLAALAGDVLPRAGEISLDASGMALGAGLALLLAGAAAAAPVARALALDPIRTLREAGARGGESVSRVRGRGALVVTQVALSLVLLVGAGLLVRSFAALTRVDPGFDPAGTLTFRVALDEAHYPDDDAVLEFQDRLVRRLEAIGGVESAGFLDALPLRKETSQFGVSFPGAPGNVGDPESDAAMVDYFWASPGAFEAAGFRVLEGRGFREGEGGPGARVAVVDDVLARRFFPEGSAVGAGVEIRGAGVDTATIVGVVDQARFYDVRRDDRGQVYMPNRWDPRRGIHVALRTGTGDPSALIEPARAVVREMDPGIPVSEVRTLETVVAEALSDERLNLGLVATFALAALLLAGLGIYGVVANAVVRRRGEIGVRMALGADRVSVVGLVLRQGLRLVALGIVLGLGGAWVASRFLGSLLYGVRPFDPATYGAVAVVIGAVALLASWLPARRATGIDPMETLRAE